MVIHSSIMRSFFIDFGPLRERSEKRCFFLREKSHKMSLDGLACMKFSPTLGFYGNSMFFFVFSYFLFNQPCNCWNHCSNQTGHCFQITLPRFNDPPNTTSQSITRAVVRCSNLLNGSVFLSHRSYRALVTLLLRYNWLNICAKNKREAKGQYTYTYLRIWCVSFVHLTSHM